MFLPFRDDQPSPLREKQKLSSSPALPPSQKLFLRGTLASYLYPSFPGSKWLMYSAKKRFDTKKKDVTMEDLRRCRPKMSEKLEDWLFVSVPYSGLTAGKAIFWRKIGKIVFKGDIWISDVPSFRSGLLLSPNSSNVLLRSRKWSKSRKPRSRSHLLISFICGGNLWARS